MKKIFLLFALLLPIRLFAETPISIALNWKAEPQFGGFYEAQQLMPLNLIQGGSGTPTLQMLLAKKVDYAIVSADEVVIAASRGQDQLLALFASFQTNPQAILYRDSIKVKSLTELLQKEDLTLLWQEGLPYAQYLKRKTDLKVKTAPYLGGLSGIQSSEKIIQQCFATSEPILGASLGLKLGYFLVADSGYNPYTTVLVTRKDYYQKNKTQAANLVGQIRKAWGSYLKDPKTTNQLMAKLNPSLDLKTLQLSSLAQEKLIQTPETLKSGLGVMSSLRFQTLIDQLFELKVISQKPKAEGLFINL